MYEYVTDKVYLSKVRGICGEIMQDLCHQLKVDYGIASTPRLVGSGGRNLITQNAEEGCDLDYNLEIVSCENFRDCRGIKESVQKAFNKVLNRHGWVDCQDSTSALTTEQRQLKKGNKTLFSIDVCIVCRDENGNWHRLIHNKHNCIGYYWNEVKNSRDVREKAEKIKQKGEWEAVRVEYLKLKNNYLCRQFRDHSSFVCYIEAVNNVYNHLFYQ